MPGIWETNGGVFLGFPIEGKGQVIRYVHDRHLVTVGPNGSGKTMRLIIPNLAELTGWSIIVNDVKGELAKMTAEHRRAAGSEVVLINPFNVFDLGSNGFDPVQALELDENFPDNALELSEAMIPIDGNEPHWPQAAQDFVAAVIMYVRLVIPEGSLLDVRKLLGLSNARIRQLILAEDNFVYNHMQLPGIIKVSEDTGWDEMAIKAGRFGDITPENRELLGVLSEALTKTRWLDRRPVQAGLT